MAYTGDIPMTGSFTLREGIDKPLIEDSRLIKGAPVSIATLSDLSTVPANCREEGQIIYTKDTKKRYFFDGGITDSDLKEEVVTGGTDIETVNTAIENSILGDIILSGGNFTDIDTDIIIGGTFSNLNLQYPVPGFEYAKTLYADFATSLNSVGATSVQDLGESSLSSDAYASNKIYGLTLGACDGSKPIIYIQGQIHGGHEWRSAYWVREFFKLLANPPANQPYTSFLQQLTDIFDFYCIPCLNPYGYVYITYQNGNGVSISRNFDYNWEDAEIGEGTTTYKGTAPFSEPESLVVKNIVETYNPVAFICCHTLGDYTGYKDYTIRPAYGSNYGTIFETIIGEMDRLLVNEGNITAPTSSPTAYNWAQSTSNALPRQMYACGFETGALMSDFEQGRAGLNGLLYLCLKVLETI